ncbi:MAG: hypothetical protein V1738_04455 [Patescibacteria group bacterium]
MQTIFHYRVSSLSVQRKEIRMNNHGDNFESPSRINVQIVVRPGLVVRWKQFQYYPPFSIALDGYCYGPTRFSRDGLRINLNHHEGVSDVAVRATCGQARTLVKQQLFADFRDENGPRATLYANDCDQDVCLASFLFMYPDLVGRRLLRQLVAIEDFLDSSGGLYRPDNDERRELMRMQAWIFEPYTDARLGGVLKSLKGDAMLEIINGVHERIRLYLYGRGEQKTDFDIRYEVLSKFDVWSLVREVGTEAKTGMVTDGIRAYMTYLGELGGRHHYALGRLNPVVPFPVRQILECLNQAEGIRSNDVDRWGGGSNRGGSPRINGSSLAPDEAETVVEECVRRWTAKNRSLLRRRKS